MRCAESASLNAHVSSWILFFCLLCGPGGNAVAQSASRFDQVEIDALDPDAWNGIVFLAKAFNQPAPFALRVGSRSGGFLDGSEIFDAVREVGPHAPDSSYCRLAWRHHPRAALVTLEWSRIDQTTVVGRLTAARDFQLVLEAYFPYLEVTWGTQGFYSIDKSRQAIVGERYFNNVFGRAAQFVVMVDQPTIGSGLYPTTGAVARKHERLRQACLFARQLSHSGRSRAGVRDRWIKLRALRSYVGLGGGWPDPEGEGVMRPRKN